MTVHETITDKGILVLQGSITDESTKLLVEDILYLNSKNDLDFSELRLILNSPGGDVRSGFMIIDMLEFCKFDIHITGLGICASMGNLILCSGTKGHRSITRNTALLSHQYSWGFSGKHHELKSTRKEEDLVHKRLIQHYVRHTNLNKQQVEKYLLPKSDVWMTPKEALKYGIVDKII